MIFLVDFGKKNIIAQRYEAQKRRRRKVGLRRCIIRSINDTQQQVEYGRIGVDVDSDVSWQKDFRGKPNNLGLT